MKTTSTLFVAFLLANICFGQVYNKNKVCGTDTIHVNHISMKTGKRISYKAFKCTQVGKLGLRFQLGSSLLSYNGETKKWLGNYIGPLVSINLAHQKFNIGTKFKLATATPNSQLAFNGDTLTHDAKLNPIKIDFYAGYSLDLNNNFSVEPYIGLTRNLFFVINEKELNKDFNIPTVNGLNTGINVNKYFKLKEFQFLSVFLSYGYGFANFKKVSASLDTGYSEWSLGFAYKVFVKKTFFKKIH